MYNSRMLPAWKPLIIKFSNFRLKRQQVYRSLLMWARQYHVKAFEVYGSIEVVEWLDSKGSIGGAYGPRRKRVNPQRTVKAPDFAKILYYQKKYNISQLKACTTSDSTNTCHFNTGSADMWFRIHICQSNLIDATVSAKKGALSRMLRQSPANYHLCSGSLSN